VSICAGSCVGEHAVAAVDPAHRERQRGQQARQRGPHVAAAEERHGFEPRDQFALQRGRIGRGDALVRQEHHAAAALPQARAQRVALDAVERHARAGEQVARLLRGLELELPAADGGREAVGPHRHPGAGLARRRTLRGLDAHQHAVFMAKTRQQLVDRTAHRCRYLRLPGPRRLTV
jgi:hypothetical protein